MHEYVFSRLNINDKNCWHWWCAGNTDTIGTAMYAPNVAFGGALGSSGDPILYPNAASLAVIAASSNHPGGANHLFADGSVKFIKNTVSSWVPDPTTGLPTQLSSSSSVTARSQHLRHLRLYRQPARLPGPLDAGRRRSHQRRRLLISAAESSRLRVAPGRMLPTTPVRPAFRRAGAVPFVARRNVGQAFQPDVGPCQAGKPDLRAFAPQLA